MGATIARGDNGGGGDGASAAFFLRARSDRGLLAKCVPKAPKVVPDNCIWHRREVKASWGLAPCHEVPRRLAASA